MKIKFGKESMSVSALADACGGKLYISTGTADGISDGEASAAADAVADAISTDSREACPGCVFAAIRGERVDGHRYIGTAALSGAVCAIAERLPDMGGDAPCVPIILVDDTVAALGRLAESYTRGCKTRIIAVTGSVGKTTTKEFIASVLSRSHVVYRTEGNYNSVIGMPLSMLGMPEDAEYAVFEMGMSSRGEIASMSRVAHPDVAVITNIGSSHLEYLGTRENIALAKLEIAEGLRPDGILLLCGGEPLLGSVGQTDSRALYFSVSSGDDAPAADCRATQLRVDDGGTLFDAECHIGAWRDGSRGNGRVIRDLEIPVIGAHNVAAALSATAIGILFGLSDDEIRRGLNAYRPVAMRQQFLTVRGATVILDCYNASPESMRAAAEVLSVRAHRVKGRQLALLGDMLELGETSEKLHFDVGRYFASRGLDYLFTLGQRATDIAAGAAAGAMNPHNIITVEDKDDIGQMAAAITEVLRPGDVLLVKASRGIAAERVVEALGSPAGQE